MQFRSGELTFSYTFEIILDYVLLCWIYSDRFSTWRIQPAVLLGSLRRLRDVMSLYTQCSVAGDTLIHVIFRISNICISLMISVKLEPCLRQLRVCYVLLSTF